MSQIKKPRSTIDKWLHFDKAYTHKQVCHAIEFSTHHYHHALEKPWEYFTPALMEKLAFLADKTITEVFWACYKRPYKYIFEDNAKLRTMAALERAGIK